MIIDKIGDILHTEADVKKDDIREQSDRASANGGIISQLKMQNEMKLTDESWISYQQGKGNEAYQKYMEDLTDMQNHVLPYLQMKY